MGSWRAALSYSPRYSRAGLTKGSGWDALAVASYFESSPPNQAANTFDDLTSSASGSSVAGTGAVTLDVLTGSGVGAVGAKGTASATLATVVSAAAGGSTHGTSAVTLATVVSAASGSSVVGSAAATLATVVSAASGTSAGGSSAETLAVLTSSASGARGASGSSAETLATVVSAGSGSVTIFGTVATLLDDLTTVATDAALPVTIDFEDGTIPAALLWAGDPGTVVSRADAGGGTLLALQFRDIADHEETYFELYAEAHAPGSLSLTVRLEVSSEENYDFLRVLVDGVDVLGDPGVDPGDEEGRSGISGGFESFTVNLSEGGHSLRFGYYKDSSADDGDDTAWISSITYPAGVRPVAAVNQLDDLVSAASGETPTYPGLYRFWRIAALATQSTSGDTGLGEVELRGSIGGADLTDTLPGIASQQYGGGPDDPSVCFDNDTSNYWTSGPEYEAVIWEFTTFPQDVQQVWIERGEMLDIQIAASNDGVTWEWKAIQRGNTGNSYVSTTPITIDLVGPNRHYDGYLGVNDLQQTNVYPIYCESDHIAVTANTTWDPIRIEKLIAHSASTYPSPPIGAITYTFFCKGVIYSDDGGYPGTLIAETAEHTTLPNGQFFDLGLADWLFLLPGTYWFGVHTGGTSGNLLTHNTVGPQTTRTVALAYGSGVPSTFPPGGVSLASGRPQPIYAVFPISTGEAVLADLSSAGLGFLGDPITGTAVDLLGDLVCEGAGSFVLPIAGTAAALLESLSSAGFGARGVLRPQQTLNGSYRPVISLNATWVPR